VHSDPGSFGLCVFFFSLVPVITVFSCFPCYHPESSVRDTAFLSFFLLKSASQRKRLLLFPLVNFGFMFLWVLSEEISYVIVLYRSTDIMSFKAVKLFNNKPSKKPDLLFSFPFQPIGPMVLKRISSAMFFDSSLEVFAPVEICFDVIFTVPATADEKIKENGGSSSIEKQLL